MFTKILYVPLILLSVAMACYIAIEKGQFWLTFLFIFSSIFFSILAFTEKFELVNVMKGVIKTRKILQEAKELAVFSCEIMAELLQGINRFSPATDKTRYDLYDKMNNLLDDINCSEKEKQQIFRRWHYWVESDYLRGIIFSGNINHPKIDKDQQKDWQTDRKILLDRLQKDDFATPEELRNIFKKFGELDKDLSLTIDDYEYYIKHKSHKSLERWFDKNTWYKKIRP